MLREELTKISKIADENECANSLENLKERYDHTVSIIPSHIPLFEFNCFEYALGLSNVEAYRDMKKKLTHAGFGSVFCNSYFISWLIKHKFIERGSGDLLLYESIYGDIYHAGTITADKKISSKWGTGCIYNHKQLEVPLDYGSMPRNYQKGDSKDSFQYFIKYLKELVSIIQRLENS